MTGQRTDQDRLSVANRLLTEQRDLASVLGGATLGNTTLQLILTIFIAQTGEQPVIVRDLLSTSGPSPAVTWRWLMVLVEDELVSLSTDGRNGPALLTRRGIDRVRSAIDILGTLPASPALKVM